TKIYDETLSLHESARGHTQTTALHAENMLRKLDHCKTRGGVVLLQPENRYSVQLKFYELALEWKEAREKLLKRQKDLEAASKMSSAEAERREVLDDEGFEDAVEVDSSNEQAQISTLMQDTVAAMKRTVTALQKVLNLPSITIIDEADQILAPTNQSLFSYGKGSPLSDRQERILAIHTVFKAATLVVQREQTTTKPHHAGAAQRARGRAEGMREQPMEEQAQVGRPLNQKLADAARAAFKNFET
ncbi:unnamed protein product, partial [Amoebophrya sp. A120]